MKVMQVAAARAIETSGDGKAPHAVRLWRAGTNITDRGEVEFTAKSAELVIAAYQKRGNPLVFDYEHETLIPLEERGGAPMKGVASASYAVLEIRSDVNGAPECWASNIMWTAEAQRQIESGERRQISPVCNMIKKTREVTEIVNVALCIEGATHQGTLLASAAKGKVTPVEDEIIQKVCEAAAAMDWDAVIALAQKAKGEEPAPVASATPPAAVVAPIAAARVTRGTDGQVPEAYSRAIAQMEAATLDSKRTNVEMLIATARDCFDRVDEREHLAAANPEATRKHIASIQRKVKEQTIAASRAAPETTAGAPKPGGAVDETHGLSVSEIQTATNMRVALADYAAAKKRHAPAGKVS